MRSRDSSWLGTVHRDGNEMMGEVIKSIKRGGKKIALRERELSIFCGFWPRTPTHQLMPPSPARGGESHKIDSRVHHHSGLNVYALRFVEHFRLLHPSPEHSRAPKKFFHSFSSTRHPPPYFLLQSAEQTERLWLPRRSSKKKSREQINSH